MNHEVALRFKKLGDSCLTVSPLQPSGRQESLRAAPAGVPGSPDQTGRPPGAEGPLRQVRGSAAAPLGDTGSW